MIVTVWAFLIFGISPQVVDLFPTALACEEFRANVQEMIVRFGQGEVSQCMPRLIALAVLK